MGDFLSKLNIIGEEVTLRINSNRRFSTKFSICLSIFTIILTLGMSFFFLKKNFDTTNPPINIEFKTTSSYPELDLHENKIYFAIMPVNAKNGTILLPNYITLNAFVNKKNFIQDEEGNVINVTYTKIPLKTSKCSDSPQEYYQYIWENEITANTFNRGMYCVYAEDPSIYRVMGQPIETNNQEIVINFSPCSLSDQSLCKDITNQDFLVVYPSPDLELSLLENFLKYVPSGDLLLTVNPQDKNMVRFTFKLETVKNEREILNDFGLPGKTTFVSANEKRTVTATRDETQIYCSSDIVQDEEKCEPYISLVIQSSGNLVITSRKYREFIFALTEIGGISEIYLIVAGIIYFIYQRFGYFQKFLVEKVLKRKKMNKKKAKELGLECNYEDYSRLIDENFDIVQLFKEINGLKVLNKICFKEHHLMLLPELLLKLKKEEEGFSEFDGGKSNFDFFR